MVYLLPAVNTQVTSEIDIYYGFRSFGTPKMMYTCLLDLVKNFKVGEISLKISIFRPQLEIFQKLFKVCSDAKTWH